MQVKALLLPIAEGTASLSSESSTAADGKPCGLVVTVGAQSVVVRLPIHPGNCWIGVVVVIYIAGARCLMLATSLVQMAAQVLSHAASACLARQQPWLYADAGNHCW